MDKSYVYWTRKELADLELKPIAGEYEADYDFDRIIDDLIDEGFIELCEDGLVLTDKYFDTD